MTRALALASVAWLLMGGAPLRAQTAAAGPGTTPKEPWAFQLVTDGYIVPVEGGYVSPTFTADHGWLHLEARYNYENLRTGSLWAGYNFSFGKTVVFNITPMIGGVFGLTTGIAPGCETSVTYKRFELSVSNEYVFDTTHHSGSFFYSWPQLTYSPREWLKVGVVEQRSKAIHTSLDTQRGFLVGVLHKKMAFTVYVLNVGWSDAALVLEVGYQF